MNIGSAIKSIRIDKGFNQKDFSELIALSNTSLSQIENNVKIPSKKNLIKICKSLNITLAYLFFNAIEDLDIETSNLEAFNTIKPYVKKLLLK